MEDETGATRDHESEKEALGNAVPREISEEQKRAHHDSETLMETYKSGNDQQKESMMKDLHKTVTDMQTAIQFLNQISGELNIDRLMDMIRSMALELLNCERVTLFLVDDARHELRGRPAAELNEPILKVPYGQGIAGRVAERGVSLSVDDAYSCPFFNASLDKLTGFKTRSILCCPIRDFSQEIIAVLEAVNKRSGTFSWNDEQTLNLFVLQIGNTLSKSQLHQRVIKEGAKIASLAQYTKKLHLTRNFDAFLALSVEAIKELVDAHSVVIFLADSARSQLWAEFQGADKQQHILRTDMNTGLLGRCFNNSAGLPTTIINNIPTSDPLLQKLEEMLQLDECRCVMLHSILKEGCKESFGVVLAINKAPSASTILFGDSFSETDKAMLSLFCRDLYDLLLGRVIEVSFASALSTVLPDGTNANGDHSALLQSQLLHYSDITAAYMRTLRCCESSRHAESDAALCLLINRPHQLRMLSFNSPESSVEIGMGNATRRSDLGPVEHLRKWGINFLSLPTEELVKLVFDIMKDIYPEQYSVHDNVLYSFIKAVASHYRDNPYHTFLHACYVLHSVWMILTTTELPRYLLDHEKLALCIAAICHDVDHDGFTNQFHVSIQSEVARRYNDTSVLENHHCALTFAILEKRNCALLEHLPRNIQQEMRRIIIQYIMGTDMSNHFSLCSELCQLELPLLPEDEGIVVCDPVDRVLLCKVALHAADISNPVRSFEVDIFMSDRVQAEFKNQTEKERELGLPVSAHMDIKTEAMKYQAEVNFIDFIVAPLWKRLAQILPSLTLCLHQLKANKEKFEKLTELARSRERS